MAKPVRRLDNSSVFAETTFRPERKFLHRLRVAYPAMSPLAARGMIRIVRRYFTNVQLEMAAPPLSGAVARMKAMAAMAAALSDVLAHKGRKPPVTEHEIAQADYAERFMDEWRGLDGAAADDATAPVIGMFRQRRPLTLFELWEEASRFAHDAQRCAQDLESGAAKVGAFRDGEAWQHFICALHTWAKKHDYPAGARKDGQATSGFVGFVQALQKEFPARFRRHDQSAHALATAIAEAKRVK